MKRVVIVGTQWGDEGKGKITDYLSRYADVVVRYQGGNNAGHTVVIDGQRRALHLLPSGVFNPAIENVMANGMVIDPIALAHELDMKIVNLHISDRAHVVLPFHQDEDMQAESDKGIHRIGTTKKGIGPAYTDKAARNGIRMGTFVDPLRFPQAIKELVRIKNDVLGRDIGKHYDAQAIIRSYKPYQDLLRPYVKDTSIFLNERIEAGDNILFEGAQGVLLCLDHGTYPYVTSSSPTAASVPLSTGIAPWLIDGALGVTKAYTTRVGEGPLPSEMDLEQAHAIREKGHEYGTTTGRKRRIGWLDLVVIRHTKRTSGLSALAITLLDVLSGLSTIKVVVSYRFKGEVIDFIPAHAEDYLQVEPVYRELPGWDEDLSDIHAYDELPDAAKTYLDTIAKVVGLPIHMFSVGPERHQTIEIKKTFTGKRP
jgi:adenylosuccinate synthase